MGRAIAVVSAVAFTLAAVGLAGPGQAARTKDSFKDTGVGLLERMIPRDKRIFVGEDHPRFPMYSYPANCTLVLQFDRKDREKIKTKGQRDLEAVAKYVRGVRLQCPEEGGPN